MAGPFGLDVDVCIDAKYSASLDKSEESVPDDPAEGKRRRSALREMIKDAAKDYINRKLDKLDSQWEKLGDSLSKVKSSAETVLTGSATGTATEAAGTALTGPPTTPASPAGAGIKLAGSGLRQAASGAKDSLGAALNDASVLLGDCRDLCDELGVTQLPAVSNGLATIENPINVAAAVISAIP